MYTEAMEASGGIQFSECSEHFLEDYVKNWSYGCCNWGYLSSSLLVIEECCCHGSLVCWLLRTVAAMGTLCCIFLEIGPVFCFVRYNFTAVLLGAIAWILALAGCFLLSPPKLHCMLDKLISDGPLLLWKSNGSDV